MNFGKFLESIGISNLFKKKTNSGEQYEENMNERAFLKAEIRSSLKDLNFSTAEINEVLSIVDDAEMEIQLLKAKLVGTNIGMECPMPIMEHIHKQISDRTRKMHEDLKAKVQDILARKRGS